MRVNHIPYAHRGPPLPLANTRPAPHAGQRLAAAQGEL